MGLNKEAYIRYKIIDECLSNKYAPYPSIQKIINACEDKLGKTFSVSAIQKDIKAMKEDELLGFMAPIKYSGRYKGYSYTIEGFSINSIPLNNLELEALEAASQVLSVFSGSRISDNYNEAVTKIFAAIKDKKHQTENVQRFIQIDEHVNHKGFEYFELLYHAISNKIPINFIHYSYLKRKYNSVIAHPFMLKEFQNRWYLLAYSEEHRELRTFGVDRIDEPLLLKKEFHNIKKEKINNYYANMYGIYPVPGENKQKTTFICSALFSKYFKANPIHKSQKVTEHLNDGAKVFELKIIPSFELLNFFTQYYEHIRIIEPIFMIKKIYNSTLKTTDYYKNRVNK